MASNIIQAQENFKEAMAFLWDKAYYLRSAEEQPQIHQINGETYVAYRGRLERYVAHDAKPAPDSFRAYTLNGLVDWIRHDVNGFFRDPAEVCIVSVTSPTSVKVMTPCKGMKNVSQLLAVCEYDAPRIRFDTYMDSEDFVIMLQTSFVEDLNRDVVLKIASNLNEEQSEQTADDGISQRLTIRSGVQAIDTAVFRNPAFLRPLRTFTEVVQPDSPFVIRFREGKQAAIFEADGNAWKVVAVQNIGEYLRAQLADCNVVVIA